MVVLHASISEDLNEKIRQFCFDNRTTKTKFVINVLEKFFEEQNKKSESDGDQNELSN